MSRSRLDFLSVVVSHDLIISVFRMTCLLGIDPDIQRRKVLYLMNSGLSEPDARLFLGYHLHEPDEYGVVHSLN